MHWGGFRLGPRQKQRILLQPDLLRKVVRRGGAGQKDASASQSEADSIASKWSQYTSGFKADQDYKQDLDKKYKQLLEGDIDYHLSMDQPKALAFKARIIKAAEKFIECKTLSGDTALKFAQLLCGAQIEVRKMEIDSMANSPLMPSGLIEMHKKDMAPIQNSLKRVFQQIEWRLISFDEIEVMLDASGITQCKCIDNTQITVMNNDLTSAIDKYLQSFITSAEKPQQIKLTIKSRNISLTLHLKPCYDVNPPTIVAALLEWLPSNLQDTNARIAFLIDKYRDNTNTVEFVSLTNGSDMTPQEATKFGKIVGKLLYQTLQRFHYPTMCQIILAQPLNLSASEALKKALIAEGPKGTSLFI